jgi:hypothetical protein
MDHSRAAYLMGRKGERDRDAAGRPEPGSGRCGNSRNG